MADPVVLDPLRPQDALVPRVEVGLPGGVAGLDASGNVPASQLRGGFRVTGSAVAGAASQTAPAGVSVGMVGSVPSVHLSTGAANFSMDAATTTLKRSINGAVDTSQTIPALRLVLSGTRDIVHFRQNGSMAMRGRVNFGNEWDRDLPRVGALFNYTIWGPDLPAQVPGQSGGNKVGMTLVVTFAGGYASEASKNVIDPGFLFGANDFIITGKNAGDIEGGTDLWGRLSEVHLYTPGATLTRMYGLIGEAAIEETATGSTIGVISGLHARGARIRADVNIAAHYSLFVTASERIGAPGEAATVTKDRSLYVQSGLSEFGGGILVNGKVDGTAQGISGGVRAGYDGQQFGVFITSGGVGSGSTWGLVNHLGTLTLTMPNVSDVLTVAPSRLVTMKGALTTEGVLLASGGVLSDGTVSVAANAPAGVRIGYTGSDFAVVLSTSVSSVHLGYTANSLQLAYHGPGVDRQILAIDTATSAVIAKGALQVDGILNTKAELYAQSATRFTGTISIASSAPNGVRVGYTGGDFGIGFSTGVSTVHMGYTGNSFQVAAHNAGVDRQLIAIDTSAFKTTLGTAVQIGRSGQTDVLTLNQASSASATAGTASALPTAPAEYITVTTPNGVRKIPAYAV